MKAKAPGQSEDNNYDQSGKLDFLRQQFQDFFENPFDAILITDIQTEKILAVNQSALRLLQVSSENIVGFTKSELHLLYDTERNVFTGTHVSEIPQELIVIRPDGTEIPVEIQSVAVNYDNRSCIMERYRDISTHKLTETMLKDELQQIRDHVDNTPLALVGLDSRLRIVIWSDNAVRMFGWTAEDTVGNNIFHLNWIHRDDTGKVSALVRDMLDRRQCSFISYNRNYTKNGTVINCEWYNYAHYDNDGNLVSIQCLVQDITSKVKLELELSHSHDLMRYVIEHSQSAIAVHDKDLRYIFVSNAYLKQYKVVEKEIIGKHHYEVFPDLPQKWRDVHQRVLKGEILSAEDDPYVRADGTTQWTKWECRPWFESDGSIGGLIVYTEVITKQKEEEFELIRAKEKAEQSEERYRLFIEQTTEGIYSFDMKRPVKTDLPVHAMVDAIYDNSILVECNSSFLKMYNVTSREDLLGKTLLDFHGDRDNKSNRDTMVKFITNGFKIQNQETIESDFSGNVHYFSNNTVGIVEKGYLIRMWGTQTDITDKKRDEIELLNAKEKAEESDRLKTAFLQNMSHEVRTPLNTIVGFSQLLVESSEDPRLKFYAEMITTGSDKLIRIVSDVIEISQIRTSRIKLSYNQTCVDMIIGKVLDLYQKIALRKNIVLKYRSKLNPDQEILTDSSKLEKILTHLVDNAVKFTYGPGMVEIACAALDNKIRISITDTGIGIPEDMQRIIFEPFRQIETDMTRTFGGNGLGLSLVKAYTELLSGKLFLSSSPGAGTTVEIELPSEPDYQMEETVETPGRIKLNINHGTVLIVEDEYHSFLYLQELLKNENVNVLRANNGKEAVEICRNNKDISLILMDIKMPVMDGTTSARIIKSINPDIPIIAQTAFAVESQREVYMNTFDGLITKPIIRNEFRELISKYFA